MSVPLTEPVKARAAIWLGFILMCLGMFMAILDIQVVATSLPSIQHALAISPDAISWIQTAYLIAEIVAIPLTGWLTRVLTLRWLFVSAVALFTIASIGCAFSDGFAMLISFRVLQGFAGGTLIPAVFSAVFLLFPLSQHPLATTMAGKSLLGIPHPPGACATAACPSVSPACSTTNACHLARSL